MLKEKDYSKKLDFSLWKRLLHYSKPFYGYMGALIVVMVLVGLIDALFPIFQKIAVDDIIVPGKLDDLPWLIGKYAGLLLIQVVNVFLLIWIAGKIEAGLVYELRDRGIKKLQTLSFNYYDKTPLGWIMSRMIADSQKVGDVISWGVVDMVWGFSMMIFVGVSMLIMNWQLGLVVLAAMPFLMAASFYFQKKILKVNRSVRKSNSRITGAYNEGIMGAKTTKTLVREEGNYDEFKVLSGRMKRASVKMARFSALYLPVVITIGMAGTGMAIWQGGNMFFDGLVSAGTVVAFLSYTIRFFEPVRELARVMSEFQGAQAAAERLMDMVELESDLLDTADVERIYGTVLEPKTQEYTRAAGDIEFCNVDFKYPNGQEVLKDFDLTIRRGQTVALVGETGSGKSTIVNLACRFYEPTAGNILIDGADYRHKSLHWLHSQLGYVLQAPHLFSGTVRENIRYGRLDARDAEVEAAAAVVQADSFINELEKGYDTEVGEGGALLSTGQKQLISFARAVLADPVFFVLDEATSSIDTETEALIQDAVNTVLSGRTSLVVAHRLSTIRNADKIIVLKDGEILECGDHESLMHAGGYYFDLYTNQFVQEEEEHILSEA